MSALESSLLYLFQRGPIVLITSQFLPLLSQSPTVIVGDINHLSVSQGKKLVLEFSTAPPGPNLCPAHRKELSSMCVQRLILKAETDSEEVE